MKFVSLLLLSALGGFFLGRSVPASINAQAAHLPTLLAVSGDPERGAFQLQADTAASFDAAGFTKIIIEPSGSGIAILSSSNFIGFWDQGLSRLGQRMVLTKTDHGWVAARDCQYTPADDAIRGLSMDLANYSGRHPAKAI